METLKVLEANSIDSVVTDPPYGLSFMNKKWDYDVPSIDFWKEVYRVLKPGGHILSFGGTRTYHRMVVNIEDAGFEIRDQIMWIYASGFPKSLNIGKAIDKIEGNEREVVGDKPYKSINTKTTDIFLDDFSSQNRIQLKNTKGSSEYEGWGTALKPAVEPIVLARKPLSEKTIAENVMRWRTGGLNIDGCRISTDDKLQKLVHQEGSNMVVFDRTRQEKGKKIEFIDVGQGRFPANVILECCCDEVIKGESHFKMRNKLNGDDICRDAVGYKIGEGVPNYDYNDKGDIHTNSDCPCYIMDEQSRGASRFFYRAKVSKKERNLGLDGGTNQHPTVKPINLLTYLCRLITPERGIILDPFMGSGSTGVAALLEGFDFIGIELEKDYYNIAKRRIEKYEEYKKIIK